MLFCHAPSLNSSSQLDLGKNFSQASLIDGDLFALDKISSKVAKQIEQPYPSEENKSSAEIEEASNISSFYDF